MSGKKHLPTSPCSTARDNCSDSDSNLNQLGSSTATLPLCSFKLSYLPHVYPSQRPTTLLFLWSWTFLFLLCLPIAPGTKAICNFPPPKRLPPFPLEDASPGRGTSAGTTLKAKRLWGAEDRQQPSPSGEEQLALHLAASCGIKSSLECRYGIQRRYLQPGLVPVEKLNSYQIKWHS